MKRVLPFLVLCLLVLAFTAFPALGAELSGGYYVVGDSAIGQDLTFYVPSDYATGSLTYSGGYLFNLTASSVYLYCPDYPDYTIYAPRFSVFQYRTNDNYGTSYQPLNLRSISDSNVEIFEDHPSDALSVGLLFAVIIGCLLFLIGILLINHFLWR